MKCAISYIANTFINLPTEISLFLTTILMIIPSGNDRLLFSQDATNNKNTLVKHTHACKYIHVHLYVSIYSTLYQLQT